MIFTFIVFEGVYGSAGVIVSVEESTLRPVNVYPLPFVMLFPETAALAMPLGLLNVIVYSVVFG